MITCKQIIDKFCDGPASMHVPQVIPECQECTTLEELMDTLAKHMDFDSRAQAALFIIDFIDYEID